MPIALREPSIGKLGFRWLAIMCPNKECKRLNFSLRLTSATNTFDEGRIIHHKWQLLPSSEAKVLPEYVPGPIKEDYYEACLIRDLSPKASATLARRCLQGMIRNFHGISKQTLYEEIQALKAIVPIDVWESIDAVREVGNIGAHMKRDIDVVIEVEPEEAQLLIGLIEQLVEDWYVAREERKIRSERLKEMAASKKAQM